MSKVLKYIFFSFVFWFPFAKGTNVYYFPFDRWTYVGITSDTIEKYCNEKWNLGYHSDIENLENILKGEGSINKFSASSVRLLFNNNDRHIYVDVNGIVSNDLKTGAKIDLMELNKYRQLLSPGVISHCDKIRN